MAKINLRKYYPYQYDQDYFIEVTDEVLYVFEEFSKSEASRKRQMYRYKAQYSLDCSDGIESRLIGAVLSPDEIFDKQYTVKLLQEALNYLPQKQAKRVYTYYIMGVSIAEIARNENVTDNAISESIQRVLNNMKKFLKKYF